MSKEAVIGRIIGTLLVMAILFVFMVYVFAAPDWATFGFMVTVSYLIDIKLKLTD